MRTITINPDRTIALTEALTDLWKASVQTSHPFLTDDDRLRLAPFVKSGIAQAETLIVAYADGTPTGFIGINGDKIEMLFLAPEAQGTGLGKELAALAVNRYGARYVDVNEQNPTATGFYRHIGFEVFDRTESDAQGNPFPILRMRL